MCPQIVWVVTPEAVKAILLGRVNKPAPRMMCDAPPRHHAAWSRVGKAWFHDRGSDRKGFAHMGANIANEPSDIDLGISTLHDIHVCRVVEISLQLCECGVGHRLTFSVTLFEFPRGLGVATGKSPFIPPTSKRSVTDAREGSAKRRWSLRCQSSCGQPTVRVIDLRPAAVHAAACSVARRMRCMTIRAGIGRERRNSEAAR